MQESSKFGLLSVTRRDGVTGYHAMRVLRTLVENMNIQKRRRFAIRSLRQTREKRTGHAKQPSLQCMSHHIAGCVAFVDANIRRSKCSRARIPSSQPASKQRRRLRTSCSERHRRSGCRNRTKRSRGKKGVKTRMIRRTALELPIEGNKGAHDHM